MNWGEIFVELAKAYRFSPADIGRMSYAQVMAYWHQGKRPVTAASQAASAPDPEIQAGIVFLKQTGDPSRLHAAQMKRGKPASTVPLRYGGTQTPDEEAAEKFARRAKLSPVTQAAAKAMEEAGKRAEMEKAAKKGERAVESGGGALQDGAQSRVSPTTAG